MRHLLLLSAGMLLQRSPLETPSGLTSMAPLATSAIGSAVVANTGATQLTTNTANNFKANRTMRFTIANASGGNVTDQVIIRGAGETVAALATGVTITYSSLGGSTAAIKLANLQDYFARVTMLVTNVTVTTNDADNFDGSLKVGERNPNGSLSEEELNFQDYRQTVGNDYANSLKVNDGKQVFTAWPGMRWMLTQLKDATSVTITLEIPQNSRAVDTTAINYQ